MTEAELNVIAARATIGLGRTTLSAIGVDALRLAPWTQAYASARPPARPLT